MVKHISSALEATVFYIFFVVLSILPISVASNIGSWVARAIGPKLNAHKTAKNNLNMVYPHWAPDKVAKVLDDMWDNLGRNIGEMPHVARLSKKQFERYVKIEGKLPQKQCKPSLYIATHFGNWEMLGNANKFYGFNFASVQRPLNNHLINFMIRKLRVKAGFGKLINKGIAGVKDIVQELKQGRSIGIMVDQRLYSGKPGTFLGHPVVSTNLPEKLYLKGLADIKFLYLKRINRDKSWGKHHKFQLYCYDKPVPEGTDITQFLNDEIARFVNKDPSQWFWVHKRWKLKPGKEV